MKKLCALFLLLQIAMPAVAWGPQGHKLVALIAWDHLTPMARKNVRFLLGKESLGDIASWADGYRPLETQTGPWHYVDIAPEAAAYDRDRDCPTQPSVKPGSTYDKWRDCAVDRILFFEGRIGDATLDDPDRAIALKYLVHLIGDLHQPFHAYGPEKGGNGIAVTEFGSTECGKYTCNLHSVWDSGLILHRRLTDEQYLARMEQEIRESPPELGTDDPAVWAGASKAIAMQAVVPQQGKIDQEYFDREIPVIDKQIELAGLRLAAVLNRTFTTKPHSFTPHPPDSMQR